MSIIDKDRASSIDGTHAISIDPAVNSRHQAFHARMERMVSQTAKEMFERPTLAASIARQDEVWTSQALNEVASQITSPPGSTDNDRIAGLTQSWSWCSVGCCLEHEICRRDLCCKVTETDMLPNGHGPLDGTFLQAGHLSSEMLDKFFDEAARLSMNIVILQNIRTKESSCQGDECCQSQDYRWIPGFPEKLGEILAIAQKRQFEVYVGLDLTAHMLCPLSFYLEPNAGMTIEDTRETVKSIELGYGSYKSFAGWYLPDEPALGEWLYPGLANSYYAGLVQAIREYSSKPILISPHLVGGNWRSPSNMARRAQVFLESTGVDVLIWQDAVGAEGVNLDWSLNLNSVGDYLDAIAKTVGTEATWSLHEAFNCCVNSTKEEKTSAYRPASIVRFANQIAQTDEATVARKIAWIQQHHFSLVDPYRHPEAERLFDSYLAYYGSIGEYLHPLSYYLTPDPDSLYPDSGNELFNLHTGDPKDFTNQEWIGMDASEQGEVKVQIDIGDEKNISWIGVHLLNMPSVGIQYPREMRLSCFSKTDEWRDLGKWDLPFEDLSAVGEYVFSNLEPLNADCTLVRISLKGSYWIFLSEMEIVSESMKCHPPINPILFSMLQP